MSGKFDYVPVRIVTDLCDWSLNLVYIIDFRIWSLCGVIQGLSRFTNRGAERFPAPSIKRGRNFGGSAATIGWGALGWRTRGLPAERHGPAGGHQIESAAGVRCIGPAASPYELFRWISIIYLIYLVVLQLSLKTHLRGSTPSVNFGKEGIKRYVKVMISLVVLTFFAHFTSTG